MVIHGSSSRRACAMLAFLLAASACGAGVAGAEEAGTPWREVKCERYKAAWSGVLARFGTGGLSREFVAAHDAFMATGCTHQGKVCPRSPQDLAIADVMTIAAMNGGTASTFLPFACPRS